MNRRGFLGRLAAFGVAVLAWPRRGLARKGGPIVSRRPGYWDDPRTWAGGRVPGEGDRTILRHAVTVRRDTTIGIGPREDTRCTT